MAVTRKPAAKTSGTRKTAAPKPAPKAAAAPKAAPVPAADKSAQIGAQAIALLQKFHSAFVELNAFAANYGFDSIASVSVSNAPAAKTAKSAAEVETEILDEDETRALSIKDLRALAVRLELDEQKVKSGILAELEEKGHFGEAEEDEDDEEIGDLEEDEEDEDTDEDEADEDDEEEDEDDEEGDEDEEGEYTREELEDLSLKELREIAKEEGHKLPDYRGLDQEGLISLILGEDDEEDGDDEDEEEIELDEDALRAMPLEELKALAKEIGVKVPARVKQPALVELILNAAEDEDDE